MENSDGGPAENASSTSCHDCGRPADFCIHEPGKPVTAYCRDHFRRLAQVPQGARVTWA